MPVKEERKLIPARKQTAFWTTFASDAAQIRKNIHCEWMTWLYQDPCSHVQTLCTPLKIHPDLSMCSTPFGACSHANGSRVGTTANSGQCIFKTEPENKINVLILKSSIYICNSMILLWWGGGDCLIFLFKKVKKWWTQWTVWNTVDSWNSKLKRQFPGLSVHYH